MKLKPQLAIQNPSHLLKILSTVLAASMIFTGPASAAHVHIPGNKIAFLDVGAVLEAYFKLAGLGEGDVTVVMSAGATVDVAVHNPGGNDPPGQQVPFIASGSETIPSDQIKNGTVTVAIATDPIEEEDVADLVDLPNPLWDFDISGVSFQTATITVIQGGVVVFQKTFTL